MVSVLSEPGSLSAIHGANCHLLVLCSTSLPHVCILECACLPQQISESSRLADHTWSQLKGYVSCPPLPFKHHLHKVAVFVYFAGLLYQALCLVL